MQCKLVFSGGKNTFAPSIHNFLNIYILIILYLVFVNIYLCSNMISAMKSLHVFVLVSLAVSLIVHSVLSEETTFDDIDVDIGGLKQVLRSRSGKPSLNSH